ncbi:hypothetical protein [Rhodoferax sp. GW822-FHT02A01]|uniref:hypothetical protein n=1 Tax=Rhodoferax sp. GW822-FHT02A01 TaxID=3141537 RepID=UPI00315DFEA3
MHTLEKRIAELEKITPQVDKTIFIIFVGVGEVGKEMTYIYDNHGNHWSRLPDETVEVFKKRAASETQRTKDRVPMLFCKASHDRECADAI